MKQSAGILLYQFHQQQLQVLLLHPGGPFWAKKDEGAWTLPKGEPAEGEDLLQAATREFVEETGHDLAGSFRALSPIRQKSGKMIHVWAVEGSIIDISLVKSNTFELEWPPKSGKLSLFPEIDKAGWFETEEALKKIVPGQAGFIHELTSLLGHR